MKSTFFQISIQKKLLQLIGDPGYGIDMAFTFIFSIDEDVI